MIGHRHFDDLDDEIRDHLERVTQEYIDGGMSPTDAGRAARRTFGSVTLTKERVRAIWIPPWLDGVWQDLTYAVRSLRRHPSFAALAMVTLALGIGANTAIFSVIDAVLLQPLRVPAADQLIRFVNRNQGAIPSLKVWREQDDLIADISAHRFELVNLTGTAAPEQVPAGRVSAGFLHLFGAPVVIGRAFTVAEDQPGADHVALLSHEFWARRFGADAGIVGQTITLAGAPHLVIGIVGAGFDSEQFDERPDVWIPFQLDVERRDQGDLFQVSGRLKPGVTLQAADARLRVAFAQSLRDTPDIWGGAAQLFTLVLPLQEAMTGVARPLLLLLFLAVACVLLIACVNVANLVLIRATGRTRELAVRAAIGAGRWRVVRQLLTESLLLSTMGGVLGLALGLVAIRGLLAWYPRDTPFLVGGSSLTLPRIHAGQIGMMDWRVVAFTIAVSLLTTLLVGLAPALQASRADLVADLKHRDGRAGERPGRTRMRSWFVAGELALAMILLVSSALLMRTFIALHQVNPGFDRHQVTTLRMSVAGAPFETRLGLTQLTRDGLERLRAVPGVLSAGVTCCLPLDTVWQLQFAIGGRALDRTPWHGFAGWTFVSPGYFDVFKIPVIRGRAFTDRDDAGAPGVVVINEAMARMFWPAGDPLNARLTIGRGMRPEYEDDPVRQIVGIVGDVRDTALQHQPRPAMYVPMAQIPDRVNILNLRLLPIAWIVRTAGEPGAITTVFQRELEQASHGLPIARVRSMDEVAAQSTARTQFIMWLMVTFAGAALLLAAIGVYGVTAYAVRERTHELGIRLALGASVTALRRMLIVEGMRRALAGIVVGVIGAFGLARALAALLFGVPPHDPVAFLAAPALLASVALCAVWLPALRATRIDPVTALRHD